MKKYIWLLVPILSFLSCSSSRQGKVIQGKDGKIEKATIMAKCTPPAKSYSKDLSLKVKAEVDSLRYVPAMQFDAAFEQKVVKLREYSSQGLDVELMLFHICEMANNRGFTSEQTSSLIERAISLYSKPLTISQNVTSYNQQGGITTGILVVPKDKEVPLNQNYILEETKIYGKNALRISPAQGTWANPFFGYPESEDSLVKGNFTNLMGVQMGGSGTIDYNNNGKNVRLKVNDIVFTCTPEVSVYFTYIKRPSIIAFGDKANPQKQYVLFAKEQ